RPTTASHSLTVDHLFRAADGCLDVAVDVDLRDPVLERERVHAHEPQLALACFERELHLAEQDGARAVQHARARAEHALDREHELGRGIDDRLPHRYRSGTVSKPIARSSAWPTRKRVFSESCGPTSCSPTGSPSLRAQGMF